MTRKKSTAPCSEYSGTRGRCSCTSWLLPPLIHADETHWYLLDKGPGKKWYAWTVLSPDTVYHRILPSRSGASAQTVLGDYAGVVVVDGYAAYQTATKSDVDGAAPATLAFCWAHVRRKFVEALRYVVGLLAKGAEQSDGGRPQCGKKIYRYPPSGKS